MKTKPLYQTYLINLDRADERLKLMENEFNKCEISYERISAIDAKTLNPSSYKVNNKYDRDLVPGEIGCYLSHVKTLEIFLNSDNEFAVIIEDDAILADDFKSAVEHSLSIYDRLPTKDQWDVLKLFNGKRKHIKIANVDEKHIIAACGTSIPITTIAAIWTRKAAEKFLTKIKKPLPTIQRPIDCDLQHAWEFDLRIYNLLPSLVKPAPVETQIQIDRQLKKAKLLRQIRYELNRVFPKYFYLINHHGLKKFYDSFIAKKNERIS
ncbi:glycosyltransferase family 25 protein [Empedobacter brevis]|uniref:glycosyltransferase family 25 protein n=1 Tax=Empedobacter brevis TaxID=247 RepID=UPI0023F24082|nr:glycosyltransferase family 25 protein [Empedobacter brevis]